METIAYCVCGHDRTSAHKPRFRHSGGKHSPVVERVERCRICSCPGFTERRTEEGREEIALEGTEANDLEAEERIA
jgi:hypothetical protein